MSHFFWTTRFQNECSLYRHEHALLPVAVVVRHINVGRILGIYRTHWKKGHLTLLSQQKISHEFWMRRSRKRWNWTIASFFNALIRTRMMSYSIYIFSSCLHMSGFRKNSQNMVAIIDRERERSCFYFIFVSVSPHWPSPHSWAHSDVALCIKI